MSHTVFWREKRLINTDPQRRCYNGCHFSCKEEWSAWMEVCECETKHHADSAAATFKSINPKREYEVRKT